MIENIFEYIFSIKHLLKFSYLHFLLNLTQNNIKVAT